MATIRKNSIWQGYCPVDNNSVTIELSYSGMNIPDYKTRYFKSENLCFYLKEGKCNKRQECPIYKDAPVEKSLDEL